MQVLQDLLVTGPSFQQKSASSVLVTPNGESSAQALGSLLAPSVFGNIFYVNESTGNDSHAGTSHDSALATLAAALAKCTANNNDVVFLVGTVHVTATVVWSKAQTHLVGVSAPNMTPRARISQTGSSVFTPLVSVTAAGCIFANLGTFHGFNDASTQICWNDTGGRNYYKNVLFGGMGHATAAAQSGSRSLVVGGGGVGECLFEDCIIGLDTITRSAANASLEFTGGSPRHTFRRCTFPCLSSSAAAVFYTILADGIDRWVMFDDCAFINCTASGGTTLTVGSTVNSAAGGLILWTGDTCVVGCSALGDTGGKANTRLLSGAPAASTSGLAVTAT